MNAHRCRIDTTTADPFYPGHPGYLAVCDECGDVGGPQEEPRDAQGIANRHEDVGGFERPGDPAAIERLMRAVFAEPADDAPELPQDPTGVDCLERYEGGDA